MCGSSCRREKLLLPSVFFLSTTAGLVSHPTAITFLGKAEFGSQKCQDSFAFPLGQQKHSPTAQILQHPLTDLLGSVKKIMIMLEYRPTSSCTEEICLCQTLFGPSATWQGQHLGGEKQEDAKEQVRVVWPQGSCFASSTSPGRSEPLAGRTRYQGLKSRTSWLKWKFFQMKH